MSKEADISTSFILNSVQKLFFSCSNLNLVKWKDLLRHIQNQTDPLAAQTELLDCTVFHSLNLQYPVKKEYQRLFIKQFITQLESSAEEVEDKVYEFYIDILKSNSVPTDHFYRHFKIDDQTFITVRENLQFVSEGTTGLSTWEGGLALAEWCIQQGPSLCRGQRVLELGCGVGLAGLAVCVSCCPTSYTFTDCHPGVLRALQHNIDTNQRLLGDTKTITTLVDWEDDTNSDLTDLPDLLLAAGYNWADLA